MDNVNHPKHYLKDGLECIDIINSLLGDEGFEAYCRGNCLKYLWRYKDKGGLEDLKKCEWYLKKLISHYDRNSNLKIGFQENSPYTYSSKYLSYTVDSGLEFDEGLC